MKINANTMEWTRAPKQYTIAEDRVELLCISIVKIG